MLQMLEVTYSVSVAHLSEFENTGEHIRRIFDLILSSQILTKFNQLLGMPDESVEILTIKLNLLKCLSMLTIGNKLFTGQEIRNRLEIQLTNSSLVMNAF